MSVGLCLPISRPLQQGGAGVPNTLSSLLFFFPKETPGTQVMRLDWPWRQSVKKKKPNNNKAIPPQCKIESETFWSAGECTIHYTPPPSALLGNHLLKSSSCPQAKRVRKGMTASVKGETTYSSNVGFAITMVWRWSDTGIYRSTLSFMCGCEQAQRGPEGEGHRFIYPGPR